MQCGTKLAFEIINVGGLRARPHCVVQFGLAVIGACFWDMALIGVFPIPRAIRTAGRSSSCKGKSLPGKPQCKVMPNL